MTSPAVVALKCTTELKRIDRGEILYYKNGKLSRDGSGVAVVTAEAVTIYGGRNEKEEISVPITVLGKTEVLMRRRDDNGVTQAFSGSANAGDKLFYEHDKTRTVTISTTKGSGTLLGIAVHSIGARTSSVDVIVNFAA